MRVEIDQSLHSEYQSVLAVALAACGGAEERKAKYMERGAALYAEGNYEKAHLEFRNVLQIDPKGV